MSTRERVARWICLHDFRTVGIDPVSWDEIAPAGRSAYLRHADVVVALLSGQTAEAAQHERCQGCGSPVIISSGGIICTGSESLVTCGAEAESDALAEESAEKSAQLHELHNLVHALRTSVRRLADRLEEKLDERDDAEWAFHSRWAIKTAREAASRLRAAPTGPDTNSAPVGTESVLGEDGPGEPVCSECKRPSGGPWGHLVDGVCVSCRDPLHSYSRVSIGVRVMAIREKQGLTQTELADKSGYTQGGISQIESGERDPSWSGLAMIAAALGARLIFDLPRTPPKGGEREKSLLEIRYDEFLEDKVRCGAHKVHGTPTEGS